MPTFQWSSLARAGLTSVGISWFLGSHFLLSAAVAAPQAGSPQAGSRPPSSSAESTAGSSSEMALGGAESTSSGSSEPSGMNSSEAMSSGSYEPGMNGGQPNAKPVDPAAALAAAFAAAAAAPVQPVVPEDFKSQAEMAYRHGLETQAHQLFLAHLASDPSKAKEDYEKVVVSPLGKRPVLAVRWGIGFSVVRDDNYGGNAHPPQEKMPVPSDGPVTNGQPGRGNSSSAAGSDSSMNAGGMSSSEGGLSAAPIAVGSDMAQFDADFGLVTQLIKDEFDRRYQRGDYGVALSKLPASAANDLSGAVAGMVPGMSPAGVSSANRAGGSSDSSDSSGIQSSMMQSSDSSAMTSMESGGAAMAGGAMLGGGAVGVGPGKGLGAGPVGLVLPEPDAPRYRPGLLFVGAAKPDELLLKAKELNLNVFIECSARIVKRPNNVVNNDIRIRVLDVATGKALSTAKLNNVEVYRATRNPKNRNEENPKVSVNSFVSSILDPTFKTIDAQIKTRPMPAMTPENVRARVATLLTSPPKERLWAIAELRLYNSRGELSDEDLAIALDLLMGDDGLVLVAGAPERQKEIMSRFVERLVP